MCQVLGLAFVGGVAMASASGLPSGLQAQPAPRDLTAGPALESRMAGGESHSYAIQADPAARLLVTVEQRGIDVAIEVWRPDGQFPDEPLIAVDGPLDRDGPESLLLPPDFTGPFEVRVLSTGPGAAPGSYVIRLEELAAAKPAERERLEAERLMTEGAALHREGSAESRRLAVVRYDAARAHWRALGRRPEEARCAFAAGEIHIALGEPKPALEHHQQALAWFTELADESGQAAAWSGIGTAQTALGDTAAALTAHRRALALESGLGRLHQEAKALNNIGFTFHSQGDLRQALDFYEQARAAFDRAGEKGAWAAAVLQNLAAIQIGLGEPAAALASNRQVLELQRALGDHKGEAQTLNNLGVVYGNLGRFGEALEAYRSAVALFRQTGEQLWEAALLRNTGMVFYLLGDYDRARDDLEQALAIFRRAGDRRGEVVTEVNLGYVHLKRGETARARELSRHAAGVASTVADRQGEMLARRLVSGVNLAADEPAAALVELTTALDLARALGDRINEALILRRMGQTHLDLEQPEEAARILEQAVALGRAIGNPGRLVEALTALAGAYRRLGRPPEARSRVEEALRLIETLRTTESDPELRASLLASQHAAFELEIALLMELEGREPGQGHARAALEVSERARARSLLDLLVEADADIREGVDPVLRDRERALLVRLNAKAGRQAELQRRPADEKRLRAAEEEVRSVLDELDRTEAEIRRQSPRYAALTRPSLATSAEIQSLLDNDTLLLEYALGEERSFLWAVDRESVAAFELPARARIEEAAREVYRRVSVLAPGDDRLAPAAAAELGRMLLGPVAGRLGERRLIIVADGELQYIPFGMLTLPGDPSPLLTRHEIVNAPSASTLALQRRLERPAPAPGTIAVLADPVFGPEDPRVTAGTVTASTVGAGTASRLRSSPSAGPFLRLPWTRREAEAITGVVPAGQAYLALDFRASRETALSPELSRYRIIHFATHGLIDARTPALSGLMLSRIGPDGVPVEGFLGLRDVYNLRLGADLVVLSGCETALGKEVRGEGLVGLTRGFLYAGAKQVVASLWRVEDRATAELMSRFYHALLVEGRPAAAALRLAQTSIRQDRRWRSPYYWSGFVLQGDWR